MKMTINFEFGLNDLVKINLPDIKGDPPIQGLVCAAKVDIHSERHFYEVWRTDEGSVCSSWIPGEMLTLVKCGG